MHFRYSGLPRADSVSRLHDYPRRLRQDDLDSRTEADKANPLPLLYTCYFGVIRNYASGNQTCDLPQEHLADQSLQDPIDGVVGGCVRVVCAGVTARTDPEARNCA